MDGQIFAWCVRCEEPPFPRGEDRLKLMVQVLQGLFLLGVRYTREVRIVLYSGFTGDHMITFLPW